MMLKFSSSKVINRANKLERRGFIRLALQEGLTLVPVYGFGENRTFHRLPYLKDIRAKLSRVLRIILQPYYGR
jgi:hypothetical protein